MRDQGVRHTIHYLDDYLFMGAPGSSECAQALQSALQICDQLGVPVAPHKVEGPDTTLTFLGIELDTVKMELHLPQDKLSRLTSAIGEWLNKKVCRKRELLSLIGHLQHACRVVRPGRTFLRRMIELSTTARELHHYVRLNAGFRSDLRWWALFLPGWNGVSMMATVVNGPHSGTLTSDASGNWGCGAFISQGEWFQFQWPTMWSSVHNTVKELLPIVMACAVGGRRWSGQRVRCLCDNAAVVAIINSGRSKDALAMHLMRCLFFFRAHFNLSIYAAHIPGKDNIAADSLSRDNVPLFRQQVQHAAAQATPLPQELCQALVLQRPDWTSQSWTAMFSCILRRV